MNKNRKNLFGLIMVIAIVVVLSVPVFAATWTYIQDNVHEAAEIFRSMGYNDKSAPVVMCKRIWDAANGENIGRSYFYDATTHEKYYLTLPTDATENVRYLGKDLWNGIITGIDSRVDYDEAVVLARFINSYTYDEQSLALKAEAGWNLLNCKGYGTMADAISKFEDYNKNASLTDAYGRDTLALAKDILFRLKAERAGIKDCGRVLPSNYGWMWQEGTAVYYRSSVDGANWNHSLPSPY